MASTSNGSLRALSLEMKSLVEEPVEGFRVKLLNEDNLFEWEVAIFGPPSTLYEGAYFKVRILILVFGNGVVGAHPFYHANAESLGSGNVIMVLFVLIKYD